MSADRHHVAGPYRAPGGEQPKGMSAAEIWCWMNGWFWPGGRPVAEGEEKEAFRLCFRGLGVGHEAGHRLWRERCDQGLDPVSGGARR